MAQKNILDLIKGNNKNFTSVQDYIESCPSVLSASGTPVGALDTATTVNEPSYYKELRQYDLHGYASTKLIDANNASGTEEMMDDDDEEEVEDVEGDVEGDVEEVAEDIAEVAVEAFSNYSEF